MGKRQRMERAMDAVKCKFLNQPSKKHPSSPADVDALFQNYFKLFFDFIRLLRRFSEISNFL